MWVASRHNRQWGFCVLWLTGSRMLILLEAIRYADSDYQFVADKQLASWLLFQRTHVTTRLPSFARPTLWMFHFSSTELGRKWTWPTPWRAATSHIFFVRMDNQFANENLPHIFVDRLVATWLIDKKYVENGHVCQVENPFLDLLPSSPGNSITVHRLSDVSTNPMQAL